ncbi:MAG: SDR family NAD(P)-dependent oxidoreductase, partial [Paracoccaceae bacterium]
MAGVQDRVALVTGCGSAGGIGFAAARALLAGGARVAITATTDRIFDRARELGPGVFAATADLTRADEVARLFAGVEAALGPVEVLVSNAGMVQSGRPEKRAKVGTLTDAGWQHHLALNMTTVFNCTRAALPAMQAAGYGRIVNMASVTGPVVTIDGSAGYAAAKAGVTGLTRATALEYAKHGITCNAVLPGWIATESASPRQDRAGRACPTGRQGTPDEVAACVLFLASAEASYVNGAMLVVDGA